MPINEIFEREIQQVEVSLVFTDFEMDPEEITEKLGLQPDDLRRKGETRRLENGQEFVVPFNLWSFKSPESSLDPNVQIRAIFDLLESVGTRVNPEWKPFFNILWKSRVLGAGSGPFYEKDVIEGIARIGAEIYQDLYHVEEDFPLKRALNHDPSGP